MAKQPVADATPKPAKPKPAKAKKAASKAATSKPKASPLRRYLQIFVPLLLIGFFAAYRVFLTPDAIFILLFVVFLLYGLAFEFLKKFVPFMVLLLSYDSLRGLVPFVSKHVHYTTMPTFDKFIGFGQLPTVRLQHLLYNGHLHWYDYYFYCLYIMHFVVPLLVAVLIWRTRPAQYWRYVWSLVGLSYAGFLTYLAFPAAPPWMASANGYIPHIQHLATNIWWALGVHNFPTIYDKFSPNEVAAVPSLHAAYPTMVTLFVWNLYGRKWGLLSLFYALSMWVGVVYMGEHYVFDVTLGIIYAVTAFLVVKALMARRQRRQQAAAAVPVTQPQPA